MLVIKDRVRFVETDMMNVVHHSNYFQWFEMGRVEYMRQAGVYLIDLMNLGYVFPITDARCSYKKSAKFDDEILICVDLIELSRVKMVYAYKVKLASDYSILAEGLTQNLFTKVADGSVARIPTAIYEKLKAFHTLNSGGTD